MEHLFTPWRMKYIMDNDRHEKDTCVFCRIAQENNDREDLILYRGKNVYVVLNRYPYNTGHLMVVPYQHHGSIEGLAPEILNEMMTLLSQAVSILGKVYNPQGFNVGANLGDAAGAGIAEHVHFHVLPRWGGDTNFVTSLGNTRIVPEDLDETWRRIRDVCDRDGEWCVD